MKTPLLTLVLLHCCLNTHADSWTNRYDGPAATNDIAQALATDAAGNVFVTGYNTGGPNGNDAVTICYNADGTPRWTNIYNGPANLNELGRAVAVNGNGTVFVTAQSYSSSTLSDIATLAYDNNGAPLWTNLYHGTGSKLDAPCGIATDSAGDVYVAGRSSTTTGLGGYCFVTLKYSAAGVPLWTNFYASPAHDDEPTAMIVTANGGVDVTGYSSNSLSTNLYATVAYTGAGQPLWTNLYGGYGSPFPVSHATAIAADSAGNAYVTGWSGIQGQPSSCFTIKYSSAGTPLWSAYYAGQAGGASTATAIAVDRNGNAFITGAARNSSGIADFATVGYSTDGHPLWTNRYAGTSALGGGTAIAADVAGNVIISGYGVHLSFMDYITIKYTPSGKPAWTNTFNGPGARDDEANALALDAVGDIFVTGYSTAKGGNIDFATLKYAAPPPLSIIATNSNFGIMSGQFGFDLNGPLGSSVAVQYTTNLVSWTNLWSGSLSTVPLHVAAGAPSLSQRFYRVKILP
ncbi:MAG TPA: SBBP repeat-containing protein [Verrucomicrobiae bacterium]|jgi:hypothetical protein|nr:SBBP repeat-containing protein [Verrucomicrobiae bacterium]